MPPAVNVDIKIQFEQTDMVPGPKGRVFRRNTLVHGGKSDERGYSFADCFLRRDEGAVVGPCFTPAGVLNVPGVGGVLLAPAGVMIAPGQGNANATRLRRTRLKEAFRFLTAHIADDGTLTLLGDETSIFFQSGPDSFDFVMPQIVLPMSNSEVQDHNIEWHVTEITTEVGVSENSVKDAVKLLRVKNAERPAATAA